MPFPLAIALTATALGIEVAGKISEHKAQAKQAEAVRREAARARQLERRDITLRQIEEGIAASRRLRDVRISAEQQEGLVRASAASAGVGGPVVQAMLGDLEASRGRANEDTIDSYVATLDQLERAKLGADARYHALVAGAPEPSTFGTAIRIGGAVTRAAASYEQINARREIAETALGG